MLKWIAGGVIVVLALVGGWSLGLWVSETHKDLQFLRLARITAERRAAAPVKSE